MPSEPFPVGLAAAIGHPQPALNGKVVIAEDIGALQAKQQYHFRRPNADAPQRAERRNRLGIRHSCNRLRIKRAALHLRGKLCDIFRLVKGHTEGLQPFRPRRKKRCGIDRAKAFLHALPHGRLRLGRNLLPDDVMDNRGKQIRVDRALNPPDAVNRIAKALILPAQI